VRGRRLLPATLVKGRVPLARTLLGVRDGILDEVAGHRLTYPVTHGARVVPPQVREDGDQMALFEEASR